MTEADFTTEATPESVEPARTRRLEQDFSKDDVPERVGPAPTRPYDHAKDRETARRRVAYTLIGILGAEALVALGAIAAGAAVADVRAVLEILFAPTATLVGTVTAFYFAGEQARRST